MNQSVRPKHRVFVDLLLEFSLPLLSGVVLALIAANVAGPWYQSVIAWEPREGLSFLGHHVTFAWLINDIFMVFFFGIAAKEITEACLPGGSLNPPRKAISPLIATLGGVAGPVAVFFLALYLCYQTGIYDPKVHDWSLLSRGWGIPTATDIALAWLVARAVFGKGHPAIDFLLLLAVADDAIGLLIIAIFYGDPAHPADPKWLGLILLGMGVAYGLRRAGVKSWLPYIFIAGPLAWLGLILAHMHPALALVPIVPFLPGPRRDVGLFREDDEVDVMGNKLAADLHIEHSTLHNYELRTKGFVDVGLFFFAFVNAGVAFADVGAMTWLIFGALVVGKTLGITFFGVAAMRLGFALPACMTLLDLVIAGYIAALGLTVALFVASAAFLGEAAAQLQGQAKMGALFSGFVGISAVLVARLFGYHKRSQFLAPSSPQSVAGTSLAATEVEDPTST